MGQAPPIFLLEVFQLSRVSDLGLQKSRFRLVLQLLRLLLSRELLAVLSFEPRVLEISGP